MDASQHSPKPASFDRQTQEFADFRADCLFRSGDIPLTHHKDMKIFGVRPSAGNIVVGLWSEQREVAEIDYISAEEDVESYAVEVSKEQAIDAMDHPWVFVLRSAGVHVEQVAA